MKYNVETRREPRGLLRAREQMTSSRGCLKVEIPKSEEVACDFNELNSRSAYCRTICRSLYRADISARSCRAGSFCDYCRAARETKASSTGSLILTGRITFDWRTVLLFRRRLRKAPSRCSFGIQHTA